MSEIIEEHMIYKSGNAGIKAYIARPAGKSRMPAVIVIHEIFGVDGHMEEVARRFAKQGYVALAPDLFSRPGTPVTMDDIKKGMAFMMSIPMEKQRDQSVMQAELAKLPQSERNSISKTMAWLMTRDYTDNVTDLKSAFNWLKSQDYVDQSKIFSLGFCMGGTLSGRLAAEGTALAGSVIFYGENPPADKIKNIECPVLGLYGAEDHRITDAVPSLESEMKKSGKKFDYKIYNGAYHAFFNDTRPHYNKEAAADAWKRVIKFFSST